MHSDQEESHNIVGIVESFRTELELEIILFVSFRCSKAGMGEGVPTNKYQGLGEDSHKIYANSIRPKIELSSKSLGADS